MTLEGLERYLENLQQNIEQGIAADLPDIVGREAVNHFQEGFQKEGFTDQGFVKWQEVKRRQGKAKGADAMRKILTGRTGALHDSISYVIEPGKVVISANPMNTGAGTNYAVVHNFGANNAGRAGNTVIPQRQFIGNSEAMNQRIVEKIERWLSEKLNR